jgi:uncharacterized OB-fold protein
VTAPSSGAGPRFDLPTIDEGTQPWWDACREGRLLFSRCGACRHAFLYVRPFCPKCWSDDVSLEQASGRGTLYTYSVVHSNDLPPFGPRVPYVAAIVDLDEGPRMMTNVEGCELDALSVGMPLQVAFREETETVTVPVFRPAP